MELASALLKAGKVYTQGYARTTSGVWVGIGPVYVSPLSFVDELAANVRASLKHSVQNVPHPSREEWKEVQRPMLEATGTKSWASLAKGSKAVGIECIDGTVTFTPSSDYQNQGGSDLSEQAVIVSLDSDNLGAKLAEAFDLST